MGTSKKIPILGNPQLMHPGTLGPTHCEETGRALEGVRGYLQKKQDPLYSQRTVLPIRLCCHLLATYTCLSSVARVELPQPKPPVVASAMDSATIAAPTLHGTFFQERVSGNQTRRRRSWPLKDCVGVTLRSPELLPQVKRP